MAIRHIYDETLSGSVAATDVFPLDRPGSPNTTFRVTALTLANYVLSTFPSDDVTVNSITVNSATANTSAYFNASKTLTSVAAAGAVGYLLRAGTSGIPEWTAITYPNAATAVGQVIRTSSSGVLGMSTATFADTYAVSTILYASGANAVSGLATGNSSVLITSAGGVPSLSTDIPTAVTIGSGYIYRAGGTKVSLSDGGTNASLTADNGAIVYSNASALALLASTATANKPLFSGTSAAPSWSAIVYPNAAATTGQVVRCSSSGVLSMSTMVWANTYAVNNLLYAATSNVITGLATANSRILVTDGTGIPTWDIDLPTAITIGSAYIYRVGGTKISLTDGGTNAGLVADNGGIVYSNASAFAVLASTATAGKVLQSGASSTPGWSVPTYPSASGTAGAILRSNGTNNLYTTSTFADTYAVSTILYASSANVVSGLATANSSILVTSVSGVPSLATDIPTAVTIGGNYIYRAGGTDVPLLDGGTNASLTANNGGIVYSTASAFAILAGTTAGKALLSGNSTTPVWSTPTYPSASGTTNTHIRSDGTNNVYTTSTFADTYTASNLLYSNGANTVTGLATANSGILVTSGSGVPSIATDIPTAVTIGGQYVYRVAGTDVAVADGGTGLSSGTSGGLVYFSGTTTIASNTKFIMDSSGRAAITSNGAAPDAAIDFTVARSRTATSGDLYGAYVGGDFNASSGTVANAVGLYVYINWGTNVSTITTACGIRINSYITSGTITTGIGMKIDALSCGTARYGLYVDAPTGGTTNVTAWFGGPVQMASNATGAGTPLLATNCPAVTVTAPYTWIKFYSSDGSTVYVPSWK